MYEELIRSLRCDGFEDKQNALGCGNKKCKYRDVDGACDLVSMDSDAADAIETLQAQLAIKEKEISAYQKEHGRDLCLIGQIELEHSAEVEVLVKALEKHGYCLDCKHEKDGDCEIPEYPLMYGHCKHWEWRGLEKEQE